MDRKQEERNGRELDAGSSLGPARGLVIALALALAVLGGWYALPGGGRAGAALPGRRADRVDLRQRDFASAILGSTETTWSTLFAARGRAYVFPLLTLFGGDSVARCAGGPPSAGAFYCASERRIYLDLSWLRRLQERYPERGDPAAAYVIAHETAHHVQQQLGILDRVARLREAEPRRRAQLALRLELQADCLAGVWAGRSEPHLRGLTPGALAGVLQAAGEVGRTAQRRDGGAAVPDSFSHGTPVQRLRWFRAGVDGRRLAACDTFGGAL